MMIETVFDKTVQENIISAMSKSRPRLTKFFSKLKAVLVAGNGTQAVPERAAVSTPAMVQMEFDLLQEPRHRAR